MALNRKQRLFAHEYSVDLNGTQAAKRAGYSEKTAYAIAEKLLRNAEITQTVERVLEERRKASEITAERLLKDCEEIKEKCLQREPVLDHDGEPTGEWKFDSRGALMAVQLQGKLQGLFVERQKVELTVEKIPDEVLIQEAQRRLNEKNKP